MQTNFSRSCPHPDPVHSQSTLAATRIIRHNSMPSRGLAVSADPVLIGTSTVSRYQLTANGKKPEDKIVSMNATVAGWSAGTAPLIILGSIWMCVVSFTSRPLYSPGKSPQYALNRKLGGLHRRSVPLERGGIS
jgi:hypothetical protein